MCANAPADVLRSEVESESQESSSETSKGVHLLKESVHSGAARARTLLIQSIRVCERRRSGDLRIPAQC